MLQMPKPTAPISLIALLIAISIATYAEDPNAAVQQKLESQYALTQPTADNTDIVTAGAVIVLNPKRGNVIMAPVSSTNFYQNTYKDGKITQNALGKGIGALNRLSHIPGTSAPGGPATRTFVPGEKMWVTKIDVKADSVVFDLFTDAYADVRYKAALTFRFAKGSTPSPDQIEKMVAEVFKVQPAEDPKATAQQQAPAGGQEQPAPARVPPPAPRGAPPAAAEPAAVIPPPPPPPADEAPAVIPPPPPPPTDEPPAPPKTTAVGQTIDQVVANLGPPVKIVKLGTKQIYYYKDFKVVFVGGKVTDVQ
jgi:hypothetical protein